MPDVPGTYGISVWVTDDTGRRSAPAEGRLLVAACGGNRPAIDAVRVAPNGALATGQAVQLTVEASDADAAPGCDEPLALTAAWRFVELPPGSLAALNDPGVRAVSFTPDVPGGYTLEVTVTDASGLRSAPARATVVAGACGASAPSLDPATFSVEPAVARLGIPMALAVTAEDADNAPGCDAGQRHTWRWWLVARPAGSQARLDDPELARPAVTPDQPGDYVFAVEVTDDTGRSGRLDDLVVSAPDCGLRPPTARIIVTAPARDTTSPAAVLTGAVVQLSAEDSFDPDAECGIEAELRYAWQLLAAPVRSEARLSDAQALNPWFQADRPGEYRVRLFVSDGALLSEAAEFVINVAN